MNKIEALEEIKKIWEDKEKAFGEKIITISTCFHSVGLEIPTTAAYIKATPIELESFLALGEWDDELIELVSKVNPPKVAWTMLADASEEEAEKALSALLDSRENRTEKEDDCTITEFIFNKMMEVAGPTCEKKVAQLSYDDLEHAYKKGQVFNALTEWENKFFRSILKQKKQEKEFSYKQINIIIRILNTIESAGAITRNSIDGDQEICDRILDALGK